MRRRGVFGYNLPPQVGNTVRPADFGIAGMMGLFARGLDTVLEINQASSIPVLVGPYEVGKLGRYVLDTFFVNLKGQPGKVLVKPYVASDAVNATSTLNDVDGTPDPTLKLKAAYQGTLDKSAWGNKIGYTLERGYRFSTTSSASALLSATSITLTSVAGIRVGDILEITSTGPVTHYTKVSAVNAGTKTLTVSALTNAMGSSDAVKAIGMRIETYLKSSDGTVSLVDLPENKIWLSMEPENTEFYVQNAFANHPYLALEDLASATTPVQNTWPAAVSTVTFLASGSDGTAPANAAAWETELASFDNQNPRFLFNSDSTLSGVNIDGEEYCSARQDSPIWIANIASEQTKSALIAIGNLYQRSDQVNMIIPSSARNVTDPIGVGSNPTIAVPLNGAVAGAWIRAIYTLGIHRVPAGDDVPLLGFVSTPDATEDDFTEDDRTDILEAGVNLSQFIPGRGLLLRSFRTPSTNLGALWGHYLCMQNFIKISAVESLYRAENRPNRITAIKEYGGTIRDFGFKMYRGSFPFGIDAEGAFGVYTKDDGTLSGFDDVFIVQADEFNNPNSSINSGESNIFVRFYPPPLNESMAIGVGVTIPL